MSKISKVQLETALEKALKAQIELLRTELTIVHYELLFDRDYGFVTASVVFSNGDMEDVPVNYRTT